MATTLTIGDFSKATFLSVKTLRHYHQVGLLEPAEVDETTGYRRYSTEQIPTAQVIRRFRDLNMPLDGIRAVIQAPDQPTRGQLIAAHLSRLEQDWPKLSGPWPRCVTSSSTPRPRRRLTIGECPPLQRRP